jgi:hypothetical protein
MKSTIAPSIQKGDRTSTNFKMSSKILTIISCPIAHNTIAGAGFGDCPFLANIIGSRAPTGIGVIDRT